MSESTKENVYAEEDDVKKKLLVQKVELAAEEIRSKQKSEERNKYVDEHLSILKKREDPYKIVMKNRINNKKKKIIVTIIACLVTLALLAAIIISKRHKDK